MPCRLVLLLAGLLLPILAVEAGLRLFGPFLPGNYETGLWVEPHPVYERFHVPNSSTWVRAAEFTIHMRFNSSGLRGPEIGPKTPGIPRLMIVGDSFIEAAQVQEESTAVRQLEALLSSGRPRVEVINAGVGNWGPVEQLLYLKEDGLALEPDLVVLAFYLGNDASNAGQSRKLLDDDRKEKDRSRRLKPVDAALEALRKRLTVVRVFETGVMDKLRYRTTATFPQADTRHLAVFRVEEPATLSRDLRTVDEVLGLLQQQTSRAGAHLMLMLVPSKWQIHRESWEVALAENGLSDDGTWDLERPNKRLVEIARRRQIPVLDLLPAFLQAARPGVRLYYPINAHWTADGHHVVAQELQKFLSTSRLLPER